MYRGIPWEVKRLSFYCSCVNPVLENGRIRISLSEIADKDIKVVAAIKDEKLTVALLNLSAENKGVRINLPKTIKNASIYTYKKNTGKKGYSLQPDRSGIEAEKLLNTEIEACSLLVVTEL